MKSVFDIDRDAKPRAFASDMGFWSIDDARRMYEAMPVHGVPASPVRKVFADAPCASLSPDPFYSLITAYLDKVREEALAAADIDRAMLLGSDRRSWVTPILDAAALAEPVTKVSADVHGRPPAVLR